MVVKQNDFGLLVDSYVRGLLRHNPYVADGPHGTDARLREWWPQLEDYWKRQIQTHIEVAIALDEPPRYNREPLQNKELWVQFIKDFRPGKSPHTVKYHCHKCKAKNVKLWRGVHGSADENGHELLCATCLAPDTVVDEKGKWQEPPYKDKDGKVLFDGHKTDQVKGWLPAIPVDDTYWGYSSVPSQDVEWWVGLPTYPSR